MAYTNAFVAAKLRRWEKYLNNYRLPDWEAIPDFGLYMEQVIDLLKQYLDYLPPELKAEQFITAATINNYVRTRVMPEPVKKRYYREHIAYLIIIASLRQTLSIALIRRIIPMGLDRAQVEEVYRGYARQHAISARFFTDQIRLAAAPILEHEDSDADAAECTEDLIARAAITGGFYRLLSEKLLLLEEKAPEGEG